MRNIKLIIEYDGSGYSGWQRQKNGQSIQEEIEKAIGKIANEEIKIEGSSRTDAGVHARGQAANFMTSSKILCDRFPAAINSKLPRDIVILEAHEMPEEFHSRYDSKGKAYSYSILNRDIRPAIMRDYMAHCTGKLDFEAMKDACTHFLGEHDFAAFRSTGSSVKTSVRTIYKIDLARSEDIIRLYIEGNGFLYNMVRIIAGTLIDVGMGKIDKAAIADIINGRDRNKAGKTAPAEGLCLEKVFY